jgi:hypothetical protein
VAASWGDDLRLFLSSASHRSHSISGESAIASPDFISPQIFYASARFSGLAALISIVAIVRHFSNVLNRVVFRRSLA